MSTQLTDADRQFLSQAIELSRHALQDLGKTPFGALIVVNNEVIAEGISTVIELRDPTAHAEVMALRAAGSKLDRHLMPDAVMYASSEPCPMCLVACYWAQIPRLVYGATSFDVAKHGFEDLQLYRELTTPHKERSIVQVAAAGALHAHATDVLRTWADQLPEPVVPKL
jgi:guanine deaminase